MAIAKAFISLSPVKSGYNWVSGETFGHGNSALVETLETLRSGQLCPEKVSRQFLRPVIPMSSFRYGCQSIRTGGDSHHARVPTVERVYRQPGIASAQPCHGRALHAHEGAERLQRHSLFVEDGCAGNWTTESGEPLVFRGHESLRRLAEWLERCFPDWEWHNVRIFETEDPNHFWVECDGRGKALVPGIRRAIARTTTSIPSNSRTAG